MLPVNPQSRGLVVPELEALQLELQSSGMVVVPTGNELQVRLSTLEYIRVRVAGGRLICEPWIGTVPRVRAWWTSLFVAAVGIPGILLDAGVTPAALAFSFLITIGVIAGGLRHLLADSAITRIHLAWHAARASSSPSQR